MDMQKTADLQSLFKHKWKKIGKTKSFIRQLSLFWNTLRICSKLHLSSKSSVTQSTHPIGIASLAQCFTPTLVTCQAVLSTSTSDKMPFFCSRPECSLREGFKLLKSVQILVLLNFTSYSYLCLHNFCSLFQNTLLELSKLSHQNQLK